MTLQPSLTLQPSSTSLKEYQPLLLAKTLSLIAPSITTPFSPPTSPPLYPHDSSKLSTKSLSPATILISTKIINDQYNLYYSPNLKHNMLSTLLITPPLKSTLLSLILIKEIINSLLKFPTKVMHYLLMTSLISKIYYKLIRLIPLLALLQVIN